jgi:hypothetical protein
MRTGQEPGYLEAGVVIDRALAVSRPSVQRVLLPDGGIAFDAIDHLGLQHEEAAVDPAAIAPGLFLRSPNAY